MKCNKVKHNKQDMSVYPQSRILFSLEKGVILSLFLKKANLKLLQISIR